MASSKEYIEFVLDQCSGLSARAMMGEYILYYGGKVVGGVYDNRMLVKPTPSAKALMPSAELYSLLLCWIPCGVLVAAGIYVNVRIKKFEKQ